MNLRQVKSLSIIYRWHVKARDNLQLETLKYRFGRMCFLLGKIVCYYLSVWTEGHYSRLRPYQLDYQKQFKQPSQSINLYQFQSNNRAAIVQNLNHNFTFYKCNWPILQFYINHKSRISDIIGMASKQPFKLINIVQKVATWSLRINKFFKHRLLSKRKNVLIIGQEQSSFLNQLRDLYIVHQNSNLLTRINYPLAQQSGIQVSEFQKMLLQNMSKTWQINRVKSLNCTYQKMGPILGNSQDNQKGQQKDPNKQISNQTEPSTIVLSNFNDKDSVASLQKNFALKKKYFDSIIVMPEKNQQAKYPQIQDEEFATTFIQTFQQKMMKNIVAYRYAHKFLNTSGSFIISSSQYDFLKKTDQEKVKEKEKEIQDKSNQQGKVISYISRRPAASKQILDNTISYLGVLVGDRDYTDLNSWTLVSLSQEASLKNPQYVAKMYYDWADGQHLPMPGSFTIFKKKVFEDKKQLNFVEYL